MTEKEAIRQLEFDREMILFDSSTGKTIEPEILKLINEDNYKTYIADGIAIKALEEVHVYRKLGTLKELKTGKRYMKLAKMHGTIGQVIDKCAEYEEIGTVEECREAMEKQIPKKLEYYGDSEDGKILCLSCQEDLWDLKECGFNNCPYCGQAIDLGGGR